MIKYVIKSFSHNFVKIGSWLTEKFAKSVGWWLITISTINITESLFHDVKKTF